MKRARRAFFAFVLCVFFVSLSTTAAQDNSLDITNALRNRGVTIPDGVVGTPADFALLGMKPGGKDPVAFLKERAAGANIDKMNPQFARCLAALIQVAEQRTGRKAKFASKISGYRPPEMQTALVRSGASKAPPGKSKHGCGTAADITGPSGSMNDPIVKAMDQLGQQFGIHNPPNAWMRANDRWHFQAINSPSSCFQTVQGRIDMPACDSFDQASGLGLGGNDTFGGMPPNGDWRQQYATPPLDGQFQTYPQFGQGQQPYQFTPNGSSGAGGGSSGTGATGTQTTQQPYTSQQLPVYSGQPTTQPSPTITTPDPLTEVARDTVTKHDSKVEIAIKPKLAAIGSKVTIAWRGKAVTACILKGPQLKSEKLSGKTTFTFSTAGTYTFRCTNENGDTLEAKADVDQVTE